MTRHQPKAIKGGRWALELPPDEPPQNWAATEAQLTELEELSRWVAAYHPEHAGEPLHEAIPVIVSNARREQSIGPGFPSFSFAKAEKELKEEATAEEKLGGWSDRDLGSWLKGVESSLGYLDRSEKPSEDMVERYSLLYDTAQAVLRIAAILESGQKLQVAKQPSAVLGDVQEKAIEAIKQFQTRAKETPPSLGAGGLQATQEALADVLKTFGANGQVGSAG